MNQNLKNIFKFLIWKDYEDYIMKKEALLNYMWHIMDEFNITPEKKYMTYDSFIVKCNRIYVDEKRHDASLSCYFNKINDIHYGIPSISFEAKGLIKRIYQQFNIEEVNINHILDILNKYKEIVEPYNYFKSIEVENNKLHHSLDKYFNKDGSSSKEISIGKTYYFGLSKMTNAKKGQSFEYSAIKMRLVLVSLHRDHIEIGLLMSIPILSSQKHKILIPISGPKNLIEHLKNKGINEFKEAFRKNIVSIISNRENIRKKKEKAELLSLSDENLATLFSITEMKHY